jgi:hypothetical protein
VSGEAAWTVAGKLFTFSVLSGTPVWDAAAAAPHERRLREAHEQKVPALEKLIAEAREELAIVEQDANAPGIYGTIIEDRPGERRASDEAHGAQHFGSGKDRRAKVIVSFRREPPHPPEGFNLVLTVSAQVRRTHLDALATRVARLLWPALPGDEPVRTR